MLTLTFQHGLSVWCKRGLFDCSLFPPLSLFFVCCSCREIWTPETAKSKEFLADLEALAPDVCITAAYGQYLPKRFLATPRLGTLNLHPSLLPRWRGASPVQRSLQSGDEETGITILYTVTKMDAGPIAVQRAIPLLGNETAGDLLLSLFNWGGQLLVDEVLPQVFSGALTQETAAKQDESQVTKAAMISTEEGKLFPHNESALTMRNKIRGFAVWPGTTLPVACSGSRESLQGYRAKVTGVEVASASEVLSAEELTRPLQELVFVPAKGGKPDSVAVRSAVDTESVLLLTSFHLPGKKLVPAKTFYKGYMVTQPAHWMDPEEEAQLASTSSGGSQAKKKKVRGRR